jgi:predicted lipid-binding transport protein (Tim44 family)
MRSLLLALAVAIGGAGLSFAPIDAEAKRLGGGRAAGMQRQAPPPQQTPPAQPANQAPIAGAAAPAAAGAAAAAGRRSWMGPIAGIAAGLGIAALFSHLGMGEGLANMMTMLLLAVVAFVVIRWIMNRMRGSDSSRGNATGPNGARLATAGAGLGGMFGNQQSSNGSAGSNAPMQRTGFEPPSTGSGAPTATHASTQPASAASFAPVQGGVASAPEGFDAVEFERIAKMIFIRLQAANDARQVDDLRKFTTPELFASLRLDLQERGEAAQQTDVVKLDAQVLETVQEGDQWIVSVRFHGLIREAAEAPAEPFDERWHLVKPVDGSREWAIAGITPN